MRLRVFYEGRIRMKIAVCILAALLAGLSLFAALKQFKKPVGAATCLLMIIDGLFLIGAAVCHALGATVVWMPTLVIFIPAIMTSGDNLPHLMMSFGSLLMLGAIVCCAMNAPLDWLFALLGGLLICGAAIMNGKLSGHFHWQHHVIRGVITLVIIVGFALL